MTWVKMDDSFPEDPEMLDVGEEAAWLHFVAICYCSRNLTDGRLPSAMVPRLTSKRNPDRLVAALIGVGWWTEEGADYLIPAYLKHQRSRVQIEGDRESSRKRTEKSRDKSHGSNTVTGTVSDGLGTPDVRALDTETDKEPPNPRSAGESKASQKPKNPRALGTNPRTVADQERIDEIEAELERCPDCGDAPARDCDRCHRKRIKLAEIKRRILERAS